MCGQVDQHTHLEISNGKCVYTLRAANTATMVEPLCVHTFSAARTAITVERLCVHTFSAAKTAITVQPLCVHTAITVEPLCVHTFSGTITATRVEPLCVHTATTVEPLCVHTFSATNAATTVEALFQDHPVSNLFPAFRTSLDVTGKFSPSACLINTAHFCLNSSLLQILTGNKAVKFKSNNFRAA